MRKKRAGFSIVDLTVALSLFATLAGLLLPPVLNANQSAERKKLINNLKQVSLATHSYHDVYRSFPSANAKCGPLAVIRDATLSMNLLPYVEQGPLFFRLENQKAVPTDVKIDAFNAPGDPSTMDFIRVQNLAGNVRVFTDEGANTAWDKVVTLKKEMVCTTNLGRTFLDGVSNTIMFSTRYAASGTMSKNGMSTTPCGYYDLPLTDDGGAFFGATPMSAAATSTSASGWQLAPSLKEVNCKSAIGMAHAFGKDGIVVSLADASVRVVSSNVSAKTWNLALQPNDGIPLPADW